MPIANISKGQRSPLGQLITNSAGACLFQIGLKISGINEPVDFSCFGLDAQSKLADDRYMTFFNQPKTPCGAVELSAPTGDSAGFLCNLDGLPAHISRLVFSATIDGSGTMRQMDTGYLRFLVSGQETARFVFTGNDFQDEKALVLGEIYRKNGEWCFGATAQGFNGGLAALVRHFGATVAEEQPQAPTKSTISLEKKIADTAPKLLSLAKKAAVSLEKHKLTDTVARVALVLDASGSMLRQYRDGKVQAVINRLLPLAVHFDDDGELDVWAFSTKALALPAATLSNYSDYIATAGGGWKNWGMMGVNNEPAVIKEVIASYRDSKRPALVIFISDGGVNQNSAIKKLLVNAAQLPIFWQFVGIGGHNYGVLEKLDTMSGRLVDNCGFFALDDLDSVSEQELYDRLLKEFPLWLNEAKQKGIVD